jgi:hypothetical protein
MTDTAHRQLARVREAREKNYLLTIRAYCEGYCPARTFEIEIKDHDDQLLEMVRKGLRCPVCGTRRVAVHAVLTAEERSARSAASARAAVNAQMYTRDHTAPGNLVVIPASRLGDDRLPPTPAGWWGR